eukprot:CAMPEP_0197519746 /NCGR_PEP_ID=MMETSP1318-20131121/5021_1 /TAXON_ID=552666 /ORGANISM="Partenskyella glossopodia, Strain RCC365" /LENGTH=53 /DNA_ID=CAMNT_0043070907 /DNA_START=54 /DNA_END=215 /DNA_ORIENTATION=-
MPVQSFMSVARYAGFFGGLFYGVYKAGKYEKIEAKLAAEKAKAGASHGHSHAH